MGSELLFHGQLTSLFLGCQEANITVGNSRKEKGGPWD